MFCTGGATTSINDMLYATDIVEKRNLSIQTYINRAHQQLPRLVDFVQPI